MVIGESSKTTDLVYKKTIANIRAAAAADKIVLSSPKVMEALAYMG
jgi:predicted membrane GTPase involved in stress response